MPSSDWTYRSAAEMAAALSAREVSAAELARESIARIEASEPKINAVCARMFDEALKAAQAADARLAAGERGPLIGVPITVKDSFRIRGTPASWGVREAASHLSTEDALAVKRVKAAGAVVLGKTNVPLWLGDWQSYNDIHGVTNNPYDLKRTPGGSSGGSAAALAAGYAPLSLGSDIGGSLRVPAHFCGVATHKPTFALCPPRGHTPPGTPALPGSVDLAVIGPMARWASDLEPLLDAIAGPDELEGGVAYKLELPPARGGALKDFRILVLSEHPLTDTEAEIGDALETLAGHLARAGARIATASDQTPDLIDSTRLYCRLLTATFAARWPEPLYQRMLTAAAALRRDDVSLRAERLRGATASFRDWFLDHNKRLAVRARWRALFGRFDAVIGPVSPTPAFAHDLSPDMEARTLTINGVPHPYSDHLIWPALATLPGLPATVVRIGASRSGLPIGVQIIGPYLEDRTPLMLARLIERAFGGFVPPRL